MLFEDTNLKLNLISEDIKSYYTVRELELENLTVSCGKADALKWHPISLFLSSFIFVCDDSHGPGDPRSGILCSCLILLQSEI